MGSVHRTLSSTHATIEVDAVKHGVDFYTSPTCAYFEAGSAATPKSTSSPRRLVLWPSSLCRLRTTGKYHACIPCFAIQTALLILVSPPSPYRHPDRYPAPWPTSPPSPYRLQVRRRVPVHPHVSVLLPSAHEHTPHPDRIPSTLPHQIKHRAHPLWKSYPRLPHVGAGSQAFAQPPPSQHDTFAHSAQSSTRYLA